MTADQRLKAARAFWLDEQATDDQIQAVLVIAQQKKFRPKFVLSLDTDRKAKHLSGLRTLPDPLAARALVIYHLAEQRLRKETHDCETGGRTPGTAKRSESGDRRPSSTFS